MKKRLLSALLALALVFVLLPTTALAGEVTTNGDISIAGKCWNFTKSTSGYETVYYQVQSNNGVFSTSLDNKTGCVWPTNPYLEITRTGNTITVIVHNKVTITTNKGTNNAAEECIEVNKSNNQTTTLNLVIKGAEGTTNNTLTLECKSYGSALSSYQGGITITGGVTVNAKSTYTNSSTGVSARAINVFNGDLTISGTGTTVNAENKDRNHPTIDVKNAVTISDGATLTAKNTNGGKAISCRSITADGYDFMGRSGNSGSYTTLTGDDKATKLQEYSSIQITPTPTPQTPFTIYGIPAQFVDGGMIATTGVTATSSNNINLPIDRVEWYTFTPGFRPDGSMDSVINKTKATGNFEAGKYYVVEIRFVQDLSPFESWDMKVSGWSDNDVSRQSVTARNDIEIYFLTPASAATHEHNWAENYDTVYHWKMCTYDGCTAIKDKALHVWNAWHTSNNEQQHSKSCSECSYSTPPHDIDLAYVSDGEQGHHLYCKHDGCTFVTGTTAHVYAEGSNICTDCGYNKSAPCDHGNRAYTNNGDGTHKVTCKACGATIVEKQSHEFGPTGACIYCGATQSGGDPTPDNPGTIVIIRPAEEEKPAQQPNPSTGANDLVGLAVAAAVAAALGSAALLRKHD